MGTHYVWQFEMGILWMASAQNLALGPFLFLADQSLHERKQNPRRYLEQTAGAVEQGMERG
jgi:hypothetical protein